MLSVILIKLLIMFLIVRLKYFILLLIAFKLSFIKLIKYCIIKTFLFYFFDLSGIKFTIILIF